MIIGINRNTFIWRFTKAIGTNSLILFRVDNLRVNELPVPTLHVEPYDATNTLVWWDGVYGSESEGTFLEENHSVILDPSAWSITAGGAYSTSLRRGQIFPSSQQTKFFRLKITGTPAL